LGGDDVTTYAWLLVVDIALIAGLSVLVGATAPRWPRAWLDSDPVPLRLMAWETPAFYRRIRVVRISRRLPELGDAFGGASKSTLPGRSATDLDAYLVEVRRAEWVHWVSMAVSVLLFAFNPWWLALCFIVLAAAGNLPFILVLRNNRARLLAIISRGGPGA
jgi:hypothetical protein